MPRRPDAIPAPAQEESGSVGYVQTAAVLVAIAVAIAVFIALMAFFGIAEYWCGLLFLWYWGSV